jgi:hypothetical protein
MLACPILGGCGSDGVEVSGLDSNVQDASGPTAAEPAATSTESAAGPPSTDPPASGTEPAATNTTPAPAKPAKSRVVRQAEITNIPLGSSQAVVVKRFGEPVGRPSNKKQDCLVYATDGGPDTWERFCFIDDKLVNMATVIGRKNALTLDPPPLKGPGKLQHPTVTPPKSK